MPDLCEFCPSYIKSTIANRVRLDLNRIKRIQYLTAQFARPLEDLADQITDDLGNLVGTIPIPQPLDFSDLVSTLELISCPLTPLALIEDPALLTDIDPNILKAKFSRIMQFEVDRIIAQYEVRIRALNSFDIVRLYRRYIKEVYRVLGNPIEFVISYALSVGYALVVKSVCPETYNDSTYPFKAFEDARKNWNFDGFLPTGLSSKAHGVAQKLAEPEVKIAAWQALTIMVTT